ncbi:Cytoplasmic dynein 1 light intermediate chain 1 [Bagarius yarrelli]|uniref:Dynein light intermediate chain n=1 Tax=Bagarius yarrelli TaxID=175774 RepID=A0A556VU78_BAGYA|nr:Cytoplasmic dynein 1 light intermediate chain 1 [Bagarius yarrelli]
MRVGKTRYSGSGTTSGLFVSSILSEVSTRSRSKLPAGKSVLLLDHTRCNAWVLDGDLYHKGLQKFALCVENLWESLAMLVVDLSRPWTALESLHKWTSVLREYLDKIRVPPETMRELEHRYGAALLYTSMKENKNLDLLYKYLVHSPSGWDNEKKIAILHENLQTIKAEDNFEDVIVKPPVRKFVHEKEIQAEDDQVFLLKLQTLLSKQPAATTGRPVWAEANMAPEPTVISAMKRRARASSPPPPDTVCPEQRETAGRGA